MAVQRSARETFGFREDCRFNTLHSSYTGYIPQRIYQTGCTYAKETSECMETFCDTTQKALKDKANFELMIVSAPRLKPIRSDQEVTLALEEYCQRQAAASHQIGSKRSLLEPPKIGWTGYVPKAKVTDLGLGVRYHVMSGHCFEAFKNSITKEPQPSSRQTHKDDSHGIPSADISGSRLYRPEGMVPKYTGYIPRPVFQMCEVQMSIIHARSDWASTQLQSQSMWEK
ncbi:sperm-associated microtubule inner protein 5 isoform X1 [Lepisosteus oculatus]|uniref:sperm-associated microtubule inner protein 5 isoform X1 n=1 Tax=Lepisosteus oculatus TaxID=7918 RepID=UPI00073FB7D7|nr:PREDICTED: uncharacterized protein C10orf82 homolog isoform X3 [Lepisosteus oculatus]